MSIASHTDRRSVSSDRYIDDFKRLFRFHRVSTGKPTDFARLANLLATNEALSSDFYSLVSSILHRENGALSETDILTAVALGIGGDEIARKGEVAIPVDLLSNFTAGLNAWMASLNEAASLELEPELDAQAVQWPEVQLESHPGSSLPGERPSLTLVSDQQPPGHDVASAPAAKSGTSAQPEPAPLLRAESEVLLPAPGTTAATLPLDAPVVSNPLVSRISGTLDRLELDSLELKHHLEAIERRISQIEPHLDSHPAKLASIQEPAQADASATTSQEATPATDPSRATPAPHIARARPSRTASGSFTFSKAMEAAQLSIPSLGGAEQDPQMGSPQLDPISSARPGVSARTLRPGAMSAGGETNALPPASAPTLSKNLASGIPPLAALNSHGHGPVSNQPRSSVPTGPAFSPATSPAPPDINSDLKRLRTAVLALGVVLVLVIIAAATFAYRLYSNRAPQGAVASAAQPTAAADSTNVSPPPAVPHQARTAPPQGSRTSHPPPPAHETDSLTKPFSKPPAEEVELESAPPAHAAPPPASQPGNSPQQLSNGGPVPSTSSSQAQSQAQTIEPATHASTPQLPEVQSDRPRSAPASPISTGSSPMDSRLPQLNPATSTALQHSTSPVPTPAAAPQASAKLASPATTQPSSAPSAQPSRPSADTPQPSSRASTPAGPVSLPSDVIMHNVISAPNPVYPPEAKAFRIEGSVIVQIVISKSGQVKAAKAIQGPMQLQLSAVNAVRSWRFRPYLVAGQPTEVNTYIRFNYNAR